MPETGRCVDPDKVDVESCKRYVPHEQEQEKEESSYSLDPFPTMIDAVIATEEANEKAKQDIQDYCLNFFDDSVITADGFELAFLGCGYSFGGAYAIYDFSTCMEILMQRDGMT